MAKNAYKLAKNQTLFLTNYHNTLLENLKIKDQNKGDHMKKILLIALALIAFNTLASEIPLQRHDTHILKITKYIRNNTLYKASYYEIQVKNFDYHKKFYFASERNGHGKIKDLRYIGKAANGDDIFAIHFGFYDNITFYVQMDGREYKLEALIW